MKITTYDVTMVSFVRLNSSTTVPVRLTNGSVKFTRAWITGNKAAQTANTGTVYIGAASGDGNQSIGIATGARMELFAPPGFHLDFFNIWLDVANANDGVAIEYIPAG